MGSPPSLGATFNFLPHPFLSLGNRYRYRSPVTLTGYPTVGMLFKPPPIPILPNDDPLHLRAPALDVKWFFDHVQQVPTEEQVFELMPGVPPPPPPPGLRANPRPPGPLKCWPCG